MSEALYSILYGAGLAAAWAAAPFSRKVRRGLLGRLGVTRRYRAHAKKLGAKPLWFHVASAGELEQCLPILDALKKEAPEKRIFLSYFSPSAESALEREEQRRQTVGLGVSWEASDYSPWDFPALARRALGALDPSDLVVVHRELWPGLLQAASARGVKRHLVATNWTRDALDGRAQRALSRFSFVGTVRPDTATRLSKWLPGVSVEPLGDPRIDRVLSRKGLAKETVWKRELARTPTLVGASLWDEDFEALKPLLADCLLHHPEWRIVLVPHEPTASRVGHFASFFTSRDAPVKPWSTWNREPQRDASHLVVDGVGWLAELYGAAEVVFVGGSFRKRVHNVLEPAAYGCPILTGPFISASPEACEMAAAGVGLLKAETGEALRAKAAEWLKSAEKREEASKWLEKYLEERQGAGVRYARRLLLPS
jgi:3-deoxy-D-manno-octulosonic-acid transferase